MKDMTVVVVVMMMTAVVVVVMMVDSVEVGGHCLLVHCLLLNIHRDPS